MKAPIFVRALSLDEQTGIEAGLRSSYAFTRRRSHMILASSRGKPTPEIARNLGGATQTVRNAIHRFNELGLASLKQESSRPKTVQAQFDRAKGEGLRARWHQSPRLFGKATSRWTRSLAAQVCFKQGITAKCVSLETIRQALKQLGVGWHRAKHWITSPDPSDKRKKKRRDDLIALAPPCGWAVGYLDEGWWSRLSQPNLPPWSEAQQLERLLGLVVDKRAPGPKALACYGMRCAKTGRRYLRFVEGRPVSQVTTQFLEWRCQQGAAPGQRKLVLIWDNASWPVSKQVKSWLREHHHQVQQDQQSGKTEIQSLPCWLPTKSPWRHRIEPKGGHGKRAIVEPARLLTARAVKQRVCEYFGCEPLESLPQPLPCACPSATG